MFGPQQRGWDMADAIHDLMTALREQQINRKPPVEIPQQTVVRCVDDPAVPQITMVTIYAPTLALCQQKIDRIIRGVERDGGMATFKGPRQLPHGGFGAFGEVFP